jgi:segregation and condensation protein A
MDNPNFHLEGIVHEKDELQDFEGPLSLILMLLQKNKIEIRDLKISEILDQYLAWMAEMQSLDLEIASEFVQMASHLLYIKTRTLLTSEEEVSELEVLMESLEQLKARDNLAAIREVIPALKAASERGLLVFPKLPEPLPKTAKEYEYRHEPVDLLKALWAVFSRGVKVPEEEERFAEAIPSRIVYSVRSKSRELLERLRRGPAMLEELYRSCVSKSEIVATFLSVLELCSMGGVRIDREEDGYQLSFVGGNVEEILEKIEE